ncbi:MAG: glycosyltransferase family 2 protein [Gammaproteobacteria bacterium]|nr:glycosyltransferase family 2 protein [Gammaproteobacteria bacterium]
MTIKKSLITCVVPAFNEAQNIKGFLQDLSSFMATKKYPYEIVVIDDGSDDNTIEQVLQCIDDLPLRLITFSRNFGKEAALTAGINVAQGDAVILIDADYQHPINVIDDFIAKWEEGYNMVYGVRSNRKDETLFKRKSAELFYHLLKKMVGIEIPRNAGDFRLLDKRVIEAIRMLPERTRFMKGMYAWVGYKSVPVLFNVEERHGGQTGWGFNKLANLALTGVTAFTDLPLRVAGITGLIISFISFLYGMFIILDTLLFGNPTPGFATTIVIITFLGGIQLLSLGVLGEYIAGIFREVKQRPNYIIDKQYGNDEPS